MRSSEGSSSSTPSSRSTRDPQLLRLRTGQFARMRERNIKRRPNARRSLRKHVNPIRQVDGLFNIVCDEDDRVALDPEYAQQLVSDTQAHQSIESGERLIHVQHVRLDHQRPRKLHPLQHSPRQLMRITILKPAQTDDVGIMVRYPVLLRSVAPLQPKRQILAHREPRKHGTLL